MPELLSSVDHSFRWHPYITIEKYSVDQTSWAEARLAEMHSRGRLPFLRRRPRTPMVLSTPAGGGRRILHPHGDWLRDIFPHGPEDGYAYDDGNLLVNAGLTNMINLLTGAAASGANSRPLKNGQVIVGVGTSSTAAAVTDTHLGGDGVSTTAYYQGSDATYPSITTPATINNQMTAASGVANFAWNEWCWATADSVNGSPTNTYTLTNLGTTSADVAMFNHKVPASSLGTKGSGASWVFSTTVIFS